MHYNPLTGNLFTDGGILIKRLHCPILKNWSDLSEAEGLKVKLCNDCQNLVVDTASLTDQELLDIVAAEPATCLKLEFSQSNLTVTTFSV